MVKQTSIMGYVLVSDQKKWIKKNIKLYNYGQDNINQCIQHKIMISVKLIKFSKLYWNMKTCYFLCGSTRDRFLTGKYASLNSASWHWIDTDIPRISLAQSVGLAHVIPTTWMLLMSWWRSRSNVIELEKVKGQGQGHMKMTPFDYLYNIFIMYKHIFQLHWKVVKGNIKVP